MCGWPSADKSNLGCLLSVASVAKQDVCQLLKQVSCDSYSRHVANHSGL
jgi:hypothetical protein